MRTLDVTCDNCGLPRPAERAPTWWLLEDQGAVMRTGPLDFCSLACLAAFCADPAVRALYALDFETPRPVAVKGGRVALFRRWLLRRIWLVQVAIVKVRDGH